MEEDIKAKLAAIRSKFREITEVLVTEMPLNPESLLEVSVMDSAQAFFLK